MEALSETERYEARKRYGIEVALAGAAFAIVETEDEVVE